MTVSQLWVQDTEYVAGDDRLLLAALLPPGPAGPIGSVVGLRHISDLLLTVTGGGLSGTVSKGAAFIAYGTGIYLLTNTADVPLMFGPVDPTNHRVDIVVAQVHDVEVGGAAADAEIRVIPGLSSQTPVAPAVPAGAYLLNTLRFNAAVQAPVNTRNAGQAVPSPYSPPFLPAYREVTASASVNMPNATWVMLNTNIVGIGAGDMLSDAASIIVPASGAPGIYDVEGSVIWSDQSTPGRRLVGISLTQTGAPIGNNQSGNSGASMTTVRTNVVMSISSRLALWGYQQTGATMQAVQRRVFANRIA